MGKTILIIILIALVLGFSGASIYLLRFKQAGVIRSNQNSNIAATPTPVPLKTWTDETGFNFQYPQDMLVNKHDEDKENYAHLEFTHPAHPGSVIVWAKDPPVDKNGNAIKDISAWISAQKMYEGTSVVDTTLGGATAKKIFLTADKKTVVSAIADDLFFLIEANLNDAPYWTNVQTGIINSLTFNTAKKNAGSGAVSGDTDSSGAVDEEEVVE